MALLVVIYFALVKSLSTGPQPGRAVMNVFLAILFLAAFLILALTHVDFVTSGASGGLENIGLFIFPVLLAFAVAVISIGVALSMWTYRGIADRPSRRGKAAAPGSRERPDSLLALGIVYLLLAGVYTLIFFGGLMLNQGYWYAEPFFHYLRAANILLPFVVGLDLAAPRRRTIASDRRSRALAWAPVILNIFGTVGWFWLAVTSGVSDYSLATALIVVYGVLLYFVRRFTRTA